MPVLNTKKTGPPGTSNEATPPESIPEPILELIVSLQRVLSRWGIEFAGYTPASLAAFRNLPQAHQLAITECLKLHCLVAESVNPEDQLKSGDHERQMLQLTCHLLNLKIPDDFMEKLRDGDICEIYDIHSRVQIYRNFEFLRHSSYDLLTLAIIPHTELFFREEKFDTQIVARSEEVAFNGTKTEPWNISDHYLIEAKHKNHLLFLIRMGYIAPVFHSVTGARVACVTTVKVELHGSTDQYLENISPL